MMTESYSCLSWVLRPGLGTSEKQEQLKQANKISL